MSEYPPPPPERLVDSFRSDQRRRWQRGDRVPAEAYLQSEPDLRADADQALELVYGEFLLREELGDTPTLDEYVRRFPQLAVRLRQQVEFHRALAADSIPDFGN
jgi:hypothetical protein